MLVTFLVGEVGSDCSEFFISWFFDILLCIFVIPSYILLRCYAWAWSSSCLVKFFTVFVVYEGKALSIVRSFSTIESFIPGFPLNIIHRILTALFRQLQINSIAWFDNPAFYKSTSTKAGLYVINLQIFPTITPFFGVKDSGSPNFSYVKLWIACSLSSSIAFHCNATLCS